MVPGKMTEAHASHSRTADVGCEYLFGSAKKESEQLECFLLGKNS